MRHSIETVLFSVLVAICFFSFPVALYAPVTDNSSLPAAQTNSERSNEFASSTQDHHRTGTTIAFHSRWEIYEVLFGTHMVIIGLVAVALGLYRWNAHDLSLISFGIFCFLYGARTRTFQFLLEAPHIFWAYWQWFLTYLTPVPAYIFFEQVIGNGWKSSIRRIWQIQIVFVIGAASVDLFLRSPGAAMVANNIMAIAGMFVLGINLFRPGLRMTRELRVLRGGMVIFGAAVLYENVATMLTSVYEITNIEPFGFIVFLGCLTYVVAYRFFKNEKDLINISHELETARQIQSFILPRETVDIEDIRIGAHYEPMASVAGDFYDFIKVDENRLGILVADVSGHGVPASLIGSMVKIAFSSQLPHASDPAGVLCGINEILCGKLEGDFVTAGYLFIDTKRQTASYAGAGHLPMLLWRGSEQNIYECGEKGIILGQFENARYQTVEISLKSGDRFFLYTDGVVEAANASGDLFGVNRLKQFIASHDRLAVGNFADVFVQHLFSWTGKHMNEALDDDLTFVVADFKNS
jgi:sigma-B regulation protein RsbU (phosphoserine phosphatase)